MAQSYSRNEIGDYEFDDAAVQAPQGYNPDVSGYENAPVGWNKMVVVDYEIVKNHTWSVKDRSTGQSRDYLLNQIRPRLEVAEGQPHAGASCLEFLPLPTPGQNMPTFLANRWGQFLHAMGFTTPEGRLVPQGFKLDQILNRPLMVKVIQQTDGNGNPKRNKQGEIMTGPALFGFKSIADYNANESGGSSNTDAPARESVDDIDL